MFKVGDNVKGLSSEYNITDTNLILGKIIDINKRDRTMKIEIIYHKTYQNKYQGCSFVVENNDEHFEKIKYDYKKEMKELSEYIIARYKTRKILNKLILKSKSGKYNPTDLQWKNTYNDKYNLNRLVFFNIIKEDIQKYTKKIHLEECMIEQLCSDLYSKIFQFIV